MKAYSLQSFVWRYVKFRRKAISRHKVHSPLVFQFITEVLDKRKLAKDAQIENVRKSLLQKNDPIHFVDYGQNSSEKKISVSRIARKSLKPKALAQLIGRICAYYKVENALELGSSLGLTSAYIARNCSGRLYTYEGDHNILRIAREIWTGLHQDNIRSFEGEFSESLDETLSHLPGLDLIFIDGHHQKEPTLQYFKRLKAKLNKEGIIIMDDIHWSADMEDAWKEICNDGDVSCSVDLYFFGILFIGREMSKQDFLLKI